MSEAQPVSAKFFGGFTHSLDAKGRLTLPARFRSFFAESCYVTPSQFQDPCLVIWTVEDYGRFCDSISEERWSRPEERPALRLWAARAFYCEIDRLGRIGVPATLRQEVGLDRDVLVHGAFGTIELWSPAVWEEYQRHAREAP